LIEDAIFASPEPVPLKQLARATGPPAEALRNLLDSLAAEFDHPGHGLRLRTLTGGYQIGTKPEHHEGLKLLLAREIQAAAKSAATSE
jgi:segregation and condensation protein B